MQAGDTRNYERMPLGKVTRMYNGRKVSWITRCARCGRRGDRGVFIPEKVARYGGSKPNVSWNHKATYQSAGYVAYWAITDHCTALITPETVDDLLGAEERRDYDRWTAEYEAWRAKRG